MDAILAIDAAWTADDPSGVALVVRTGDQWTCRALAPSYDSFVTISQGGPVDWATETFSGSAPNVPQLLAAARGLLKEHELLTLVTVDMPLATVPITGYRVADKQISITFGGMGCSAHPLRAHLPGEIGVALTTGLQASGFPLATSDTRSGTWERTVEVYPQPALLTLMECRYCIPYKIRCKTSKVKTYWRGATTNQRKADLRQILGWILASLQTKIDDIPLKFPAVDNRLTLKSLQKYEDAIDALICAWCGICYLAGDVYRYGDETAAIWVPK